jgi:hypothetical protein
MKLRKFDWNIAKSRRRDMLVREVPLLLVPRFSERLRGRGGGEEPGDAARVHAQRKY